MMKRKGPARSPKHADAEVAALRQRLEEAEETLEAIRQGHVEALVVAAPGGPRIFTLEGADHRYRRVVETMNEGALLVNPAGLILYSNAAFAAVVHAPLETIAGRNLGEFILPASRPAFEALLASATRTRAAEEMNLCDVEGAPVAAFVSMSPNEDGETGVCVIVTNLTAQKRNEAIVASERLASSILDQAAEAIVVCDANGLVTRASRAARAIGAGNALRQPVVTTFPLVAGNPSDTRHPAEIALGGDVVRGLEMTLATEGRPLKSVLCTAAPLTNDQREILGCVMSLTDITAQKNAEAERTALLFAERAARASAEKAREDAEASNRSKDEFLATISHELRTPLNAIVGWSRLMSDASMPEDRRRQGLRVIRRNADAQARLIEDLLDVSRIVSGKMRLDVRSVELGRILEAVKESVKPALDAKAIHLDMSLPAVAPEIAGDETRLQQIVWNLVSNAAKFTPRDGHVKITLSSTDSTVKITVADDGQGIKKEFLPYVFDRFRQADGGISRLHGGLGLGLAISRHLVELHGGVIRVDSDGDGQGSTFTVELPRPDLRAPATAAASAKRTRTSLPPAFDDADLTDVRVLVVEDDDDSRELLVSILTACGAEVEGVANGPDALGRLAARTPHVLVSDIGLPTMDGYALIKTVRSQERDLTMRIPALALTAYARSDDRRRALAEGFQMHLAKPVDPSKFAIAVASLAKYSTTLRPI